jgi:hypothetical protein
MASVDSMRIASIACMCPEQILHRITLPPELAQTSLLQGNDSGILVCSVPQNV